MNTKVEELIKLRSLRSKPKFIQWREFILNLEDISSTESKGIIHSEGKCSTYPFIRITMKGSHSIDVSYDKEEEDRMTSEYLDLRDKVMGITE